MRLLLDTQVAIWSMIDSDRLQPATLQMIADRNNSVYVSAISILEIAIKRGLRRRNAPDISAHDAIEGLAKFGFEILEVTAGHAAAVEALPLLHKDPFDRLVVAQALTEPMHLLTRDAILPEYGPTIRRV